MADGGTFDIEGTRKLRRGLADVVDDLDDQRPVGRPLATALAADMARRAPVDTGRLRASSRPGRITATSAGAVVSAPYANFVESGTRHMRAQPFMVPALNAIVGDAERLWEDYAQDSLDEAGRKADGRGP